jgi:hypothetical protein
MKARGVFLSGLMFCVSAAHAQVCETRSSNLGNFARFPIGMTLKVLPKGIKREPNCTVYRKNHSFDCGFTEGDGSSYIASGHEIVRVERDLQSSSALPPGYPLKYGMAMEDAAKILSAANPTMKLKMDHSGAGGGLTTPECLKNRYGSYYFSLSFDKAGGLVGMAAGYDTPEN